MESTGTVKSSVLDGSGALDRTVDQVGAGAHDVIDKASNAARPMVDRIASGAHVAVDKIAGATVQAADSLGVKAEQLKNIQDQALAKCQAYVRENPVTSLGMAVAAGYLLSKLLSSR